MSSPFAPSVSALAPARAFGKANVFSTSPQSLTASSEEYLQHVVEVARWSEAAGCTGILVYTDNGIVDPWLVSQAIVANTAQLEPLIAVQPLYLHPYAAAKMVSSLAFLYGRRVVLNMVAGGFKNDLASLGDATPHDKRYDRLIEYVQVLQSLLGASGPVSFSGEYYRLDKAVLKPALPPHLQPGIFISGSSEAGRQAAAATGAVAIQYPEPPASCSAVPGSASHFGLRLGIIARPTAEEAWEVAYQRFPFDRRGQITHELAMRVSDSSWHKRLSSLSKEPAVPGCYWLGPFEIAKSNCPYLVGDYEAVASDLRTYMDLGHQTFILDIPPSAEDLQMIQQVFERASLPPEVEVRA